LLACIPLKRFLIIQVFRRITAIELVRSWLANLRFNGFTVKKETALSMSNDLVLTRNRKSYRTNVVVIATGAKPRRLGLPN
jgi:thioredoxin reductase